MKDRGGGKRETETERERQRNTKRQREGATKTERERKECIQIRNELSPSIKHILFFNVPNIQTVR